MRAVCLIAIIALIAACNQANKSEPVRQKDPLLELRAREMADSVVKEALNNSARKQQEASKDRSPVKVVKAYLDKDEYGSTDVVVTLKNVSGKVIDGIKVRWLLKNNFGEDVNELDNAGIVQEILRPNKSATYRWSLYSTTAKKIEAYVFEAHFKDGGTWSATNYY